MGNDASQPVRNLDKRTARRRYRDDFADAIAEWRVEQGVYPYPASPPRGGGGKRESEGDDESGLRPIRVFVRKRPIHPEEVDAGEFDVISCCAKSVTLHDARMHSDMQRQIMHHHSFVFDGVFHEDTGNNVVFAKAVAEMIPLACDGKVATVMAYGQTGSGKTFTMTSVYANAVAALFEELGDDPAEVSLMFLELTNTRCSDLLGEGKAVKLVDGTAVATTEVIVESPEETMEFIQFGNRVRRTEETGVHAASSRSHSVLRIYIRRNGAPEGCLVLVDLAGSEQAIDSAYHNAQRQKEGAAINSSLSALKGCIRARAAGSDANHHFRKSVLTMALKASFTSREAATVIIATASPASKDTEHSLNTLRHACIMHGDGAILDASVDVAKSGTTTTVQLGRIDVKAEFLRAREEQKEAEKRGSCTFGADAVRSNGNERSGGYGVAHTAKELEKQQRRAERAAMRRLHPAYVEKLVQAREAVVKDSRHQQARAMQARESRQGSGRRASASRHSATQLDPVPARGKSQHPTRERDLARHPASGRGGKEREQPRRSSSSSRQPPQVEASANGRAHVSEEREPPRRSQSSRGGAVAEPRKSSRSSNPHSDRRRASRGEGERRASRDHHAPIDSEVNPGTKPRIQFREPRSEPRRSEWDDDHASIAEDDRAVEPAPPPISRQQQKAEAAAARRKAAAAAKIAEKEARRGSKASGTSSTSDSEIDRLEAAISASESSAARAGLQRRLAALKASKIREQRKRESAARAAAEAATEAAAEADRRKREADARAAADEAAEAARAAERAARAQRSRSPPAWDDPDYGAYLDRSEGEDWPQDNNDRRNGGGLRVRVHHKEPERNPRRKSEQRTLEPVQGSPVLARRWGSHSSTERSSASPRLERKSSTPVFDAYGRKQHVGAAAAPWGNEYSEWE